MSIFVFTKRNNDRNVRCVGQEPKRLNYLSRLLLMSPLSAIVCIVDCCLKINSACQRRAFVLLPHPSPDRIPCLIWCRGVRAFDAAPSQRGPTEPRDHKLCRSSVSYQNCSLLRCRSLCPGKMFARKCGHLFGSRSPIAHSLRWLIAVQRLLLIGTDRS